MRRLGQGVSPWRGRRVLVTSGPTREPLDPVRFLTNASTGRMGWALAAEASRLGARVTVVTGPVETQAPPGVRVVPVVTGLQMYKAALRLSRRADLVIAAAAVSDWRPRRASPHKLKRGPGPLRLTLIPNPDIIKAIASQRTASRRVLVGFALETRGLEASARDKLRRKGLDMIVANGAEALASARARATLVTSGGARRLPRMAKRRLARAILKEAERLF